MTERMQVYKCSVCGNIVMVMHAGGGTLVCCGKNMDLVQEKNADVGLEKHVPVIEKTADGVLVKIGSVPHPMEAAHYIEWIELTADGAVQLKFLQPGQKPEAFFNTKAKKLSAREYCNIHGLWKT